MSNRVCIVGLKSFDYLVGADTPRYVGGIEKDLVLIARTLSYLDFDVSLITFDHEQGTEVRVDGVQVIPSYKPKAGLPLIRFVYPRIVRLMRSILRARPDTLIVMGVGIHVFVAVLAKRFLPSTQVVFLAASDSDCDNQMPLVKTSHEKVLHRYSMKKVDSVLAQNERQVALIRHNYGRDSDILRVPAYAPQDGCYSRISDYAGDGDEQEQLEVLWVGRISQEKRPDRLLRIAEACPTVNFTLIGEANYQMEDMSRIKTKLEALDNVSVLGRVEGPVIPAKMKSASYLLNTSDIEGFPAVFREAWYYGLPVVTMLDPDSLIDRAKAGYVYKSTQECIDFFRSTEARSGWLDFSGNATDLYDRDFGFRQLPNKLLGTSLSSAA